MIWWKRVKPELIILNNSTKAINMKSLKREIKLYICTKLILWAMNFIPQDCIDLKLWFLKFPHKSIK
jgi:hypothetical protein